MKKLLALVLSMIMAVPFCAVSAADGETKSFTELTNTDAQELHQFNLSIRNGEFPE